MYEKAVSSLCEIILKCVNYVSIAPTEETFINPMDLHVVHVSPHAFWFMRGLTLRTKHCLQTH